jgi:hypothetical protein
MKSVAFTAANSLTSSISFTGSFGTPVINAKSRLSSAACYSHSPIYIYIYKIIFFKESLNNEDYIYKYYKHKCHLPLFPL